MSADRVSWVFDCPCKNEKIKRKSGGKPPKDIENFFVRKEEFGTLYYSKSKTPIYHESYFVETSNPNSRLVLSSPIRAILEVTGECDLNCIHCYRPESKKEEKLELNAVKSLISELKDMNAVGIQFMGGEPFLHEDLPKMLKRSKESGLKNEVITSGYNIDKPTIEECSKLIDGLFISIDGRKEIHNRIRQNSDSFDSAIKTLKEFSQRDVYTTVIMTLNKLNYNDIEEVYSTVSNCGAKELLLKKMLPIGRGKNVDHLYLGKKALPNLDNRIRLMSNERTKIHPSAGCINLTGDYTFFGCPGGRTQVVVDCDGDVYRCLYQKDPNSCIGNIYDNKFKEIWKINNETLTKCDCTYSDRCGDLCKI
jgi:MoaA/NifB/PqqE/SkfB family radical SAM enzyme